MKFPGEAAERIARSLQVQGPATVSELGVRLGMTAAGIRRPLASLAEAEFVVSAEESAFWPGTGAAARSPRPGLQPYPCGPSSTVGRCRFPRY